MPLSDSEMRPVVAATRPQLTIKQRVTGPREAAVLTRTGLKTEGGLKLFQTDEVQG